MTQVRSRKAQLKAEKHVTRELDASAKDVDKAVQDAAKGAELARHPERVMSLPGSAASIRVMGELRAGIARRKGAGQA